jgi:hypothetical protein
VTIGCALTVAPYSRGYATDSAAAGHATDEAVAGHAKAAGRGRRGAVSRDGVAASAGWESWPPNSRGVRGV